jgi:hypothetical protein
VTEVEVVMTADHGLGWHAEALDRHRLAVAAFRDIGDLIGRPRCWSTTATPICRGATPER